MAGAALDIYCDAFVARGRHELSGEPIVLSAPGVRGVAWIRLLVTDDAGYDRLVADVAGAWRGVVMVFEQASRCNELLRDQPGWSAQEAQLAMVLRDLEAVADVALPDGVYLRPVSLVASEAPGVVPLREAASVAIASDPSITGSADQVAEFLSGLPPSVRVFAAVDEEGVARATAACHVFGEYAQIFFVNTEPAWRRRGIGGGLTAEALRAAATLGARRAILHATHDGVPVYGRLGFEALGWVTRYAYAAD